MSKIIGVTVGTPLGVEKIKEKLKPVTIDDLQDAVETALQEAKESGEFDGPPGPAYTLNDTDKNTIAAAAAALVSVPVQSVNGKTGAVSLGVGDITAGTFAGQVVANASGQSPDVSCLRNSRLVSADTDPTVEGEIVWHYK